MSVQKPLALVSFRSDASNGSQHQSISYEPVFEELSSLVTAEVSDQRSEAYPNKHSWYIALTTGLCWWLPEICASLLSIVSFLGLVVLVKHYEGKGVQDVNLPASLTLNGLIALLSTLIRAALMVPVGSALSQEAWVWLSRVGKTQKGHAQLLDLEISDAASRGAWGGFLFLLQMRRQWLAYLASIVTIVSLVFGTFTQQLLTFKSFPVTDNPQKQPTIVPRSEAWTQFVGNPAEAALDPPLLIKAAAYNGIMNPVVEPITALCPTGNCTWPVTPSLAICGACSNTTYQRNCSTGSYTEPACNFSMPSGTQVTLQNVWQNGGEGNGFAVFPSQGAKYEQNDTSMLYIANFEMIGAGYSEAAGDFDPSVDADVNAYECAMWMCVQAYNVSMTTSRQAQVVTQNFSRVVNSSFSTDEDLSNITFAGLPEDMNPTPDATNYSVVLLASEALRDFTETLLNGTVFLNLESVTPSSDVVQAIWNVTGSVAELDSWIKNLAGSMTNVIRSSNVESSDESNLYYHGTAYQLGYEVRWVWITLPAILVVMSALILATIMIQTATSPVPAWKASPLTLLFVDVDSNLRRNADGRMSHVNGVRKSVGKFRVVLRHDEDKNWRLKVL